MNSWNAEITSLVYQPLQGIKPIRLLRLYPGEPSDPLRAELIPTTVEEAFGRYEATSYTWGSPENPSSFYCNDFKMTIQKNAFDMLHDLRLREKPRIIWNDAICIDQSNIEERSFQVFFMDEVYRWADKVIVWLGKSDEYSSLAMAYAARLDTAKLLSETGEIYTMGSTSPKKSYFFEAGEEVTTLQHQNLGIALVKFINRPWFNRVWVQQEASLCAQTRVVCGNQEVDWDNVFLLAWMILPSNITLYPDYILDDLDRTLDNITAVQYIQRRRKRLFQDIAEGINKSAWSLVTYLGYTSRLSSTDPRDKLYALQHVAQDANTWFKVDYRVPWQLLYIDVSRKFLQRGLLGFLRNAGLSRQKPGGGIMPSWAFDLRADERWGSKAMAEHPAWMAGGPKYTWAHDPPRGAGSVQSLPKRHRRRLDLPDELKNSKDPRKALIQSYANVKALLYDEIIYMSDCLNNPFDVQGMQDILQKDLDYIANLEGQTYLNNDNLVDAYNLTLILCLDDQQEIVGSEYIWNNWDAWMAWTRDPSRGRDNMPILECSMEASGALVNFRFAMTKHGYFCLVPRDTRLHDAVSILVGYTLGVVIRPWQPPSLRENSGQCHEKPPGAMEKPEYFELIGDCFIHGMMVNEARCIIEEFHCNPNPTPAKLDAMGKASKFRDGESWKTLGLNSGYERILETLGERFIKLV
ncbi:heterokaryon incompatibility protein-domain-containing protein [Daldinia decipiens]|uniref:heterokaryon incompatibility protein-domain-containing protein n=1 Tax=Daldinia decipiens TaxID=326647 RepID=UPI0020C28D64|nr:heterokaryon incompatibility protein-domain-containing protein [Daldinia decipiens]KAI1653373.1 heterokaryon incompatibility protein-domain-containing protein [Daldinia decipiens]